jgi:predicted transcriptional regulator
MANLDWKHRYNTLAEASKKLAKEKSQLQSRVIYLQNENIRLAAENSGLKETQQIVANDFNKRNRDTGREVERLRKLLKNNGIMIGDG